MGNLLKGEQGLGATPKATGHKTAQGLDVAKPNKYQIEE
jgi:hypothetical protein